ncbi:hypothetical protein SLS62_002451 [Diatrype stigma]|uniref:Glucose-methanol-choline oxidoreductase N-terminal domain-containing protein n=1 Tax=Diatrype stigma TaxID=117547 RepID=A0AAN9V6N7_9PEZI
MRSNLLILASLLAYTSSVFSAPQAGHPVYAKHNETDTFDYIVIGSGPGGGPLSVNLAEAGYTVLLLEAGQNHTAGIKQNIPAYVGEAQWDEEQGWWFYTKNYSNETEGAKSSKMVWEKPNGDYWIGPNPPEGSKQLGLWYPRAGTLGGCDTHNGGLTVRPSNWDWDNIADITGDESWHHDELLKYFEKLERNLILPPGTKGHGFSGYQPVSRGDKSLFEQQSQVVGVAQGTAAALGFTNRSLSTDFDILAKKDINEDLPDRDFQNDAYQISFKKDEKGRRFSAGSRVNEGVAKGIPLTVRFDSLVTKIQIDDDLTARGVEYFEGQILYRADPRAKGAAKNNTGIPRTAYARREVIVSGGTFNTPQLLMLSGIGAASELAEQDIPVVVDLPGVGKNLRDHYEVPVIHEFRDRFTFFDSCANDGPLEENACYVQWNENGTGPWSTLGFYQFALYTSSVAPRGERDLILYGTSDAVTGHLPPYMNFTDLDNAENVYTYTVSESHPHNRAGTVRLRTADPRDVPEINFEYFADEDGGDADIQGLVDGIEFTRRAFAAVPGDGVAVGELWPGPDVVTQDQLREYVRAESYGHHAAGTAAIGADDDPLAVLDSRFRVRGVKGLRVVDMSVFPTVPGTFPLISIFMMSEKASATILEDAKKARA